MNENNSYINQEELIFNKDGGILSGGFSLNKLMFNKNVSPISTVKNVFGQEGGKQVSDMFNDLVVPIWLYNNKTTPTNISDLQNLSKNINNEYNSDDEIVEDNLYNELLNLVTYKNEETKNNKTEYKNTTIKTKNTTKKNKHINRKHSKKNKKK